MKLKHFALLLLPLSMALTANAETKPADELEKVRKLLRTWIMMSWK